MSRLTKAEGPTYTVEGHALRVVCKRASQWGVDEKKIGVMGFSAGGEIAAMVLARFDVEAGVEPAFLLCADNDQGPSIGIASMYQRLKKAGTGLGSAKGLSRWWRRPGWTGWRTGCGGAVCLAEGLVGEYFEALGGRLDEGWPLDEPDSDEPGLAVDPEVSAGGTAPSELPIDG